MKKLLLFGALALSINAFGQVPNYVPTNGLVGWWPFNGNANDESGNGNNGTVSGATLTADRFGIAAAAYDFDGIDDYIEVSDTSELSFGSDDFSVAIWFAMKDSTGSGSSCVPDDNGFILSMWETGGSPGQNEWLLYCDYPGNNPQIRVEEDVTQTLFNSEGTTDLSGSLNDWNFILGVREGDFLKIYLNGVEENSVFVGNITINEAGRNVLFGATNVALGAPGCNVFSNIKLDDSGIWNRALSECEIEELYNAQITIDNSITQNGASLTATQTGATYQWIDCDNFNAPITGEVNQVFFPSSTGNYAVEVTIGDCSSTSECRLVDFTGIDEFEPLISVHPNPTKDEVTLSIGAELLGTGFVVTDNAGRIILTDAFKSTEQKVNLSGFDNGVYFIRTDKESPVKIIKQ